MQNKMRERVSKATVSCMNEHTWYLCDQHYDLIVARVLGKEDMAAAKADYAFYTLLVGLVSHLAFAVTMYICM